MNSIRDDKKYRNIINKKYFFISRCFGTIFFETLNKYFEQFIKISERSDRKKNIHKIPKFNFLKSFNIFANKFFYIRISKFLTFDRILFDAKALPKKFEQKKSLRKKIF
jgi:hypothetical protein